MNKKPFNLIKITEGTFQYYINNVKGNADCSYEKVKKKLTRNWIAGNKLNEDEIYEWRHFGNLIMKRDKKTDRIVNLLNDKVHKMKFNIDMKLKHELEVMLGLIEEPKQNILDTAIDNTYKSRILNFIKYGREKYSQLFSQLRG